MFYLIHSTIVVSLCRWQLVLHTSSIWTTVITSIAPGNSCEACGMPLRPFLAPLLLIWPTWLEAVTRPVPAAPISSSACLAAPACTPCGPNKDFGSCWCNGQGCNTENDSPDDFMEARHCRIPRGGGYTQVYESASAKRPRPTRNQ